MILTVTLNPAIDATITLEALIPGQVNRASGITRHAGGKGVNAASCLADWGAQVAATGLLGAANAAPFEALFTAKGITDQFCLVPGETRQNIKLSHGWETTDINLPGLQISAPELAVFKATLYGLAAPGSLVLLAGSVPAGVPDTIYAELIETLGESRQVVLDTSGAALAAALVGRRKLPFCIKPNRAELEAFCGHALPDQDAVAAAAQALVARGVGLVVVSMGAEGALFVTDGSVILAQPARVLSPVSTVGAGDAMVAGILAACAEGAPPERLARLATGFACAKLGQAGPNLPSKAVIEAQAASTKIKFSTGEP